MLLCDGCDVAFHTYCVDLDRVPVGAWFCENCNLQRVISVSTGVTNARQAHNAIDRRTRGQQRRLQNQIRANSSNWARVWQTIRESIDFDLDFPFDSEDQGYAGQSRRRARFSESMPRESGTDYWQRRMEIAERQGAPRRFRDGVTQILNPRAADLNTARGRREPPPPESVEELRAWNAFEKARDLGDGATPQSRKRKSVTASPAESEPTQQPERRLKRPRTRRTHNTEEATADSAAGSSSSGGHRGSRASITNTRPLAEASSEGPSFLQSLLNEVQDSAQDRNKNPYHHSPLALSPDHASPGPSSPDSSPQSSNPSSPRAASLTPPPLSNGRNHSPTLTSRIDPIFPRAEVHNPSPEFSPASSPLDPEPVIRTSKPRGPAPAAAPARSPPLATSNHVPVWKLSSPPPPKPRSKDTSPTRAALPLEVKADLQKMVTAALKPHYKKQTVNKDQYTDINRNVSRMLYEKVSDVKSMDKITRENWEKLAQEEVGKAVKALAPSEEIVA